MTELSEIVGGWPVGQVAAAVIHPDGAADTAGDIEWTIRIASVSKIVTAYAFLVAFEEGTVDFDEPAGGIEGVTLLHLLAHASGLGFSGDRPVSAVGTRRVYSNVGIERAADHLGLRSKMSFERYLGEAVLDPLGMSSTRLTGSPAHDVHSSTDDLVRFGRELLRPSLVSAATLAEATRPHFPSLAGVLPGIGRFDPLPWGIGFEIKGDKSPHWSGSLTSARTFGHFGGSGTFLWVDPVADVAMVALTDRKFDTWAMEWWPAASDLVIGRASAST